VRCRLSDLARERMIVSQAQASDLDSAPRELCRECRQVPGSPGKCRVCLALMPPSPTGQVRGLFEGDGAESSKRRREVVKIELQQLTADDAAKLIEALRAKHSVSQSVRPVAVGISLQVGEQVKVNHVVCGLWGYHLDPSKRGLPPLQRGDVILKVDGVAVNSLNVGQKLREGRLGSHAAVTYARGGVIGSLTEGHTTLLRQDRTIVDELVAIEEALDDWREAARILGGDAGRVASTRLDALGKHVAVLGSAVASQEAQLSAANHTLAKHVEALEDQLLTLAKGQVVKIDEIKPPQEDSPSQSADGAGLDAAKDKPATEATQDKATTAEEDKSEALLIGPAVARVRTEDELRRQIEALSRALAADRARAESVEDLKKELRSMKAKELSGARDECVARGYILGGDGAHGYSKKLEKELEALRAKNAALQREVEAARRQSDKQVLVCMYVCMYIYIYIYIYHIRCIYTYIHIYIYHIMCVSV